MPTSPIASVVMHPVTRAAALGVVAAGLAACAGDAVSPAAHGAGAPSFSRDDPSSRTGAVYTLTNAVGGNAVLAFRRAADGTLTALGTYPTGGAGVGGTNDPLASQYSVLLSDDHRLLYAVDAGSNSVTSFRVADDGTLARADRAASGGTRPVSLARAGNLLYVLNTGDNTVHGYRSAASGRLAPLPGATRALAPGAAGASTIRFSADGRVLIVTERVSNRLEAFPVGPNGRLGAPVVTRSAGATPFGFDVVGGTVVVSDGTAAGQNGLVSSYDVGRGAALTAVTGALDTGGQGSCWAIGTRDGRYAYTVNAASGSLTEVVVRGDGRLVLVNPAGPVVSTGTGSVPLDPALSGDDKFLYVLKAGTGTIGVFRTGGDHGLKAIGDAPAGAPSSGQQGLAAF